MTDYSTPSLHSKNNENIFSAQFSSDKRSDSLTGA